MRIERNAVKKKREGNNVTKLIITPIDPTEPGSYALRREYRRITRRLSEAGNTRNVLEQVSALDEADNWVIGRLRTDDGTPIDELLKAISAKDFDNLWFAAGTEDDGVPPANASSSSSPSEEAAAASPAG